MKEVKRQIEELVGYEAFDGTCFANKFDCETYESSAINVLFKKLEHALIKSKDLTTLFDGCEEVTTNIYLFKTQEDIDIASQILFIAGYKHDLELNRPVSFNYKLYKNSNNIWCFDYFWTRDIINMIEDATDNKFTVVSKEVKKKK